MGFALAMESLYKTSYSVTKLPPFFKEGGSQDTFMDTVPGFAKRDMTGPGAALG